MLPEEDPTLSVSQFIDVVNGVLKDAFGAGVWVQGEIEGFNGRGKHTYFNIVERSGDKKASLNVAVWEFSLKKMKPLLDQHRLTLADGIKVRLFGVGDIYPDRGSFSFKASNIDPRFTLGDLAGQRDEIVQRLKKNDLYDANRRVALPVVPLRIALITSVGSAAHADTLHELENSGIGFEIFVHDVRVQGDAAVPTIVDALARMGRRDDIDIVMLVRGGGSKVDLLAFDSEEISAAIGKCPKPVFTGIGHEIDFSIADEVAYRAFKTPTACAAGVVEVVAEFVQATEQAWADIASNASELLQAAEHNLSETAIGVKNLVTTALTRSLSNLDVKADRVRRRPSEVLGIATMTVKAIADRVRLLDPVNTMARGWSITRNDKGEVVRSTKSLKVGQQLVTSFADGSAVSAIESIEKEGK